MLAEKSGTVTGKAKIADLLEHNMAASPEQLRDHRLIVMFFDLSSMQDEDIDRAVDAATKYVNTQMAPADLVAMVSMSTGLSMDQDFTSDKAALLRGLGRYNGTEGTVFANGNEGGNSGGTADDASSFTADDSEYNALNTDRELFAIRAIARSLERVEQRKSLLYFSGGLTRQGIENQASMRAATNEAVKANMAIYSVDSRGLEALPPVGNASKGSLRGTAAFNGGSMQANLDANFGSQEVLSTLSADTAIFITMDEGGGYYDSGYVQPLDYFGDGTRIPMIVVSPYSKGGHISHTYTDHVSVLKFIEANWTVPPITNRSRDNLPNPITGADPYKPTNGPAIGDLMDLFSFQ